MTDVSQYGPWAVIAGGSEGVGAELAHQLAGDGFHLVLVARKPGPLEATAEAARALGVQVRTVAADLTDPAAIEAITDATADVEVGLLIYNAGANSHGRPFTDGDLAGFRGVIDLNITAMLALTHHYARPMKERRRGGILLVGSLAGYVGTSTEAVYGGAKAFGRIFAEGLWAELRDHGVHVLELVLGVTRTPAMERAGLRFDVPGLHVSEPADVAREGLAALAAGPVHVISGNEALVERRTTSDRARLVAGTEKVMRMLVPDHRG
ncbi:SDR family NAD(P)-dependent oxidoreductase [Nocardioides sp. zg-536]|uniref:SDR family NAD(P)-dependent oxidoreductase n=1 Tax=Nocardioides faecalis TaxID=2803858 RepID=A0A939BXA3_9ACTN|nr:SDR family NAD(P)-dependent oxidoreductase [Nocardioides faecalis]MBM9458605.1 SDR family NAD(P)-dependent oxidoreductase [Nocardioides faecalis]MBS4752937.1 SDR family NAD(P)-dependent oxidoreductase [Nocardioides faecalis]QVI58605.1 SDR family NAD(P)-dependent oxidoreductase [Nocardioides faecalis]